MVASEAVEKNAQGMSDKSMGDKLREVLKTLDSNARANLLNNFEKAILAGTPIPGSDLVIEELKSSLRGKKNIRSKRQYDPKRMFFEPLAPFLISELTTEKTCGTMRRASIVPLWTWLGRDVLPDEFHAYEKAVLPLLIGGQNDEAAKLAYALYDKIVSAVHEIIAASNKAPNGMQRFLGQLGGPKVLEDLMVMVDVLENREILYSLQKRLGEDKFTLNTENKAQILFYMETVYKKASKALPYAFILLKNKLEPQSQILKVLVDVAQTDDATKLGNHPYACAIEIMISDIERTHKRATHHLRRMEYEDAVKAIKDFMWIVRGLQTEVDVSENNPWTKSLSFMRTEMGRIVMREIELLPMDLRKFMGMSDKNYKATPEDLTSIEGNLDVFENARLSANEMVLNEPMLKLNSTIKQLVETGANNLLEQFRMAKGKDEKIAHQLNCAIRICKKIFGDSYAQLLQKGMELASAEGNKLTA